MFAQSDSQNKDTLQCTHPVLLYIEIFKAPEVLILELCTLADIIYIYTAIHLNKEESQTFDRIAKSIPKCLSLYDLYVLYFIEFNSSISQLHSWMWVNVTWFSSINSKETPVLKHLSPPSSQNVQVQTAFLSTPLRNEVGELVRSCL